MGKEVSCSPILLGPKLSELMLLLVLSSAFSLLAKPIKFAEKSVM
jgi:hypothetical protein